MLDPYLWLEDFTSPEALDWVRAHNAASAVILEADPRYGVLFQEALDIAGAKDRIPAPSFLNGEIYNFWQDEDHLRGLWRETTLADYRNADPAWIGTHDRCEPGVIRRRVPPRSWDSPTEGVYWPSAAAMR